MDISIHKDLIKTFKNIVNINNSGIIYSGDLNIPISNKYFIFLFDNSNETFINLIKYITDEEEIDSSFDFSQIQCSISFEKEQILSINILNNDITKTEIEINNLFLCAEESNAEIIFSFDISFIKNYFELIDSQDGETHLFDYIIYKFQKKLSNIIIFDENSFISKNSLLFFELSKTLLNTQIFDEILQKINLIKSDKIIIYKKSDNIYWKLFNKNINNYDITIDDETIDIKQFVQIVNENNFIDAYINNNFVISTSIFINQILFINLFNKDDLEKQPFILDPISKNFINF